MTQNLTIPISIITLDSSADGDFIITSGVNDGIIYSGDGGVTWAYNDVYSSITYNYVASSYTGQYSYALSDIQSGNLHYVIKSSNFGADLWIGKPSLPSLARSPNPSIASPVTLNNLP